MKDIEDQPTAAEDVEPTEAPRVDLVWELRAAGRPNLLDDGIPLDHLEALLLKCGHEGRKGVTGTLEGGCHHVSLWRPRHATVLAADVAEGMRWRAAVTPKVPA